MLKSVNFHYITFIITEIYIYDAGNDEIKDKKIFK
jgi:hypothetical protein